VNPAENDQARTGIEQVDAVDLVTHDPKTDEYALIMVETRPWSDSPERLKQLQDKVNNYLHFALDGQLADRYPGARGRPIRIQLDCPARPTGKTADFLRALEEAVHKAGVRFVVNVLG
jgi:hypothetical protein